MDLPRTNKPLTARRPAIVAQILAMVVLAAAGACRSPQAPAAMPANHGTKPAVWYGTLQTEFRDPGMLYAPFIFWFWDEPLDPAKMSEMARVMGSQGFNPGYAHARKSMVGTPDLPPSDWLGDAWFTSFGAALKEAEARNAYLGYCDEYWWPSFQAYGRVLAAHPELKAQSLRWDALDVAPGARVEVPSSFFAVAAERADPIPAGGVKKLAPAVGKWIWHPGGTETAHRCWFRRTFDLPAGVAIAKASVKIIADNAYVLFLNGEKVGSGEDWEKPGLYDVTTCLRPGRNSIAVEARNASGPFGLLFGLAASTGDDRIIEVCSDGAWLTSLEMAAGWEGREFGAAGWQPAREIAEASGGPWRYVPETEAHVPTVIRSHTLRVIGSGAPFTWRAPEGSPWRIYVFNLFHHAGADGSTVNYIDARLAPAFISIALEPYAARLGDKLGRSIPGDFIDNEGDYGWGLAWSGTLDERYRKRYGRDIRLWLPLMVDRDAEGSFARARWEWFDIVSDIYAETFRAVTDWHQKRGMYTTAHFWEEGIQPQVNAVGDHLKMLRTLTMPGQDCLGRKALKVHDFKEIESVAEFENSRAATELMGAAGFDGSQWGTFNPVFLKQAANAITAWGMSHVIPHGVFTTRKLTGNPWPPDWYSESPMFPYMHLWTDFVRRASYVNSLGQAAADVLLYNPIESAWINVDASMLDREMWTFSESRPGGKRANEIESVYAKSIDALTEARVEFLVGDRYYLKQMKVANGALVRGGLSFRAIVLPALDILQLETARRIVDFAKSGGHVYALADLPDASAEHGEGDPLIKALMQVLTLQPTFKACNGIDGLKALLAAGDPGLASPVEFLSGSFPLLQHRRRIDGRDFFWLANNTPDPHVCEAQFRGVRGAASIWDCETGEIRSAASADSDKGSRVGLLFKPYEAYWLVFDPAEKAAAGPAPAVPAFRVVSEIGGPWLVNYDPAVQPVMEYPVKPPAVFVRGVKKPLADWKAWGLGKFSGLLDYSRTVDIDQPDKAVKLDLGRVSAAAEVWVNGVSCGARLWGPHVYAVGAALRPGKNEIRVRVANLIANSYGEMEEAGLLGPVRLVIER